MRFWSSHHRRECLKLVSQKQRAILNHLRFTREIERAKAGGVDVIAVLAEVLDRERLSKTKNYLLFFSGVWCFVGPSIAMLADIYVKQHSITVEVPTQLIYWTCTAGFLSILASQFNLVNPKTLLQMGIGKKEDKEDEILMSRSGKFSPLIEEAHDPNDEF